MRQRIEKEKRSWSKHLSLSCSMAVNLFWVASDLPARASAAPSLSEELAVFRHRFFDVSSSLGFVRVCERFARTASSAKSMAATGRKVFRGGADGLLRFGRFGGQPGHARRENCSAAATL